MDVLLLLLPTGIPDMELGGIQRPGPMDMRDLEAVEGGGGAAA